MGSERLSPLGDQVLPRGAGPYYVPTVAVPKRLLLPFLACPMRVRASLILKLEHHPGRPLVAHLSHGPVGPDAAKRGLDYDILEAFCPLGISLESSPPGCVPCQVQYINLP